MFIDGRWVEGESGERCRSIDPYRGVAWAEIPIATPAEVDAAVRAAARAFEAWGRMQGRGRARILHQVASVVAENVDDIAAIETTDNGKPIRETRSQALLLENEYRYFYDRGIARDSGFKATFLDASTATGPDVRTTLAGENGSDSERSAVSHATWHP